MLTLNDILIAYLDRAVSEVQPRTTDPQAKASLERTLENGFAALRHGGAEAMRSAIVELRAWTHPNLETA